MVSLEKAVIARLSRGHEHFEILVDPDKALDMKKGLNVSIENILAAREIFKDARKGERASSSDLEKDFGTSDVFKVAHEIIKHGEVQLTTEQKRKMMAEKEKQIADIISRQAINPQTKLPHPQTRILNAMEESKAQIDPFKPASEQVDRVVTAIAEILPISMERIEIAIRVPMEYAGKASSQIRNIAPIKKEEWKSDAWIAVIEIPAGLQADIYSKLNDITAGKVEVRVISREKA